MSLRSVVRPFAPSKRHRRIIVQEASKKPGAGAGDFVPIERRLFKFKADEIQRERLSKKSIHSNALTTVLPATPALPLPDVVHDENGGNGARVKGLSQLQHPSNRPRSRPASALERVQKELEDLRLQEQADAPLRPQEEDDSLPPLEEAEGGITCRVVLTPTDVLKTCPDGPEIEYKLTQHAEKVLGDPRVVDTKIDASKAALMIERLEHGSVFSHTDGDRKNRPFWSGGDDPKHGRIQNFSDAAKAKLRADVAKLHENGIAHGDIHAGNIGILTIDEGIVTDAILIDYSEALDKSFLQSVPTKKRAVDTGLVKKASWTEDNYTQQVMRKSHDTVENLFEEAKAYDNRMLDILGV